MARIRTIKPAFWQDYRLSKDLTRDERLFYIGLWNEADDKGRFLAHPRRLLGAIFPYEDDISEAFIERSLNALARTGRLVLYSVDGEPYGQLVKFEDHQKVNRPQPSRIPAPEADSAVIHGTLSEGARSEHGAVTAVVVGEGEEEGSKSPSETRPKPEPPVSDLWATWLEEFAGQGRPPTLTKQRRFVLAKLWLEQLRKTPDPMTAFRAVLRAVKRSDHHMSKREYQYPESLFRSEERRDRWAQAGLNGNGANHWADAL